MSRVVKNGDSWAQCAKEKKATTYLKKLVNFLSFDGDRVNTLPMALWGCFSHPGRPEPLKRQVHTILANA